MPIRVVLDYPLPHWMRRFGRVLLVCLGFLLIMVGMLAAVLPIIYVIAFFASLAPGGSRVPAPDAALAGAVAVMCVALTTGLRLIRGKRRLVLFLRRFGFTEATRALTFAVVTALGSSWRLITLDDAEIAPVGPRKGMRWLSLGLSLVGELGHLDRLRAGDTTRLTTDQQRLLQLIDGQEVLVTQGGLSRGVSPAPWAPGFESWPRQTGRSLDSSKARGHLGSNLLKPRAAASARSSATGSETNKETPLSSIPLSQELGTEELGTKEFPPKQKRCAPCSAMDRVRSFSR